MEVKLEAMLAKGALLLCAVGALSGCGQKGPLYLPDKTGEIITRPSQTPPESPDQSTAPNSPQTVDTPPAPATPAPEVTAPADGEAKDKKDEKGAVAPRR